MLYIICIVLTSLVISGLSAFFGLKVLRQLKIGKTFLQSESSKRENNIYKVFLTLFDWILSSYKKQNP